MNAHRHDPRPAGNLPDDKQTQLARVRARMDQDEVRSEKCFEAPEVLDGEAELVAAGLPHVTRMFTELSVRIGCEYKIFQKYMTGGRGLPLWIAAALREIGKGDVTDVKGLPFAARAWCLAVARALVEPFGYSVSPAPRRGDVVPLIAEVDSMASNLAGNAMRDMSNDGRIDATEATARLPEVHAMLARLQDLEAGLIAVAHPTPASTPIHIERADLWKGARR